MLRNVVRNNITRCLFTRCLFTRCLFILNILHTLKENLTHVYWVSSIVILFTPFNATTLRVNQELLLTVFNHSCLGTSIIVSLYLTRILVFHNLLFHPHKMAALKIKYAMLTKHSEKQNTCQGRLPSLPIRPFSNFSSSLSTMYDPISKHSFRSIQSSK